jgi:LacI family transcriptional regulator
MLINKCIYLLNRLGKNLNELKTISLHDISVAMNLSKATISYVLNGRGDEKRVNKNTQEKILKFAKANNYQPNQLARGLSRGKSDMIGLVIPNISDSFYARIARRIEKTAEQFGYNVVFSSTGESKDRESKLIRTMLDRQVDGLIIATCQKNSEDILSLKKRNIPFVLIDRYYPEIETNIVSMDNEEGISLLVEQLIQLGRKRIGFVSLDSKIEPLRERLDSYVQTMKKHGLPVEEGFIQELDLDNMEAGMHNVIKELVQFPKSADAIVFATHFLAAEGLRELKKMNIRVPADVAMVSFGQMNSFDLTDPPITSNILPADEIGDQAVDILLKCLNEKKMECEKIIIKTKLVVRKSCGTI